MQRCAGTLLSRIENVKKLLADPRVDPAILNNTAVITAAVVGIADARKYHNIPDILEILLADSRIDPTAQNNEALRRAVKYKRHEVVDILLKDSRVQKSGGAEVARQTAADLSAAKAHNESKSGEVAHDGTMKIWRLNGLGNMEFTVADSYTYMYTYSFCEDFSRTAELVIQMTAPAGATFNIVSKSGISLTSCNVGVGGTGIVSSETYATFDGRSRRTLRIPFTDLGDFNPSLVQDIVFTQFSIFGDRLYTLHMISFDGPQHLTFCDLTLHKDGGPANYNSNGGAITFSVNPDAAERPKLAYKGHFCSLGRHQWRVYIPTRVEGDIASTAVFLYSSDYQEVDFELGYGSADRRAELNAQPDDLVAYLTTQAQDGKRVLMKGDHWYDLAFVLDVDSNGHFLIKWYINGVLTWQSLQGWGPLDLETGFRALVSLENLWWIGAADVTLGNPGPRKNRGLPAITATFDYYSFTPPSSTAPALLTTTRTITADHAWTEKNYIALCQDALTQYGEWHWKYGSSPSGQAQYQYPGQ
ncbi:hypothetical protein HDU88_005399 [Geranomyces variabilis]|nr:hypothetical protein HDU88_005399 [Geranomyces variabilis]